MPMSHHLGEPIGNDFPCESLRHYVQVGVMNNSIRDACIKRVELRGTQGAGTWVQTAFYYSRQQPPVTANQLGLVCTRDLQPRPVAKVWLGFSACWDETLPLKFQV
jgi:hypothetical protein